MPRISALILTSEYRAVVADMGCRTVIARERPFFTQLALYFISQHRSPCALLANYRTHSVTAGEYSMGLGDW
ncbi:MAG: hypothetical protein H6653_19715 [Ardenticatenaceae bacterium]|nr:hypothetical protein [Ardenticatenaceae bacterium]